MKKMVITSVFLAFGLSFFSACGMMQTQDKALVQEVNEKLTKMQELVKFSDSQAKKLKKIELSFLQKKSEIENCTTCNKDGLLKELREEKAAKMEKILERHQYIKYKSIEDKRVKKGVLMAQ